MIVTETKKIREIDFVHTYSDAGMMIQQDGTGTLYAEAYDPVGANRTYQETEIPVESETDEAVDEIVGELKRRW